MRKFETSKTSLVLQLCANIEQKTVPIDLLSYLSQKMQNCFKAPKKFKISSKLKDCDFCGENDCLVFKTCGICDYNVCHVCFELSTGSCIKCKMVKTLRETSEGQCKKCRRFLVTDQEMVKCRSKSRKKGNKNYQVFCDSCFDKKRFVKIWFNKISKLSLKA